MKCVYGRCEVTGELKAFSAVWLCVSGLQLDIVMEPMGKVVFFVHAHKRGTCFTFGLTHFFQPVVRQSGCECAGPSVRTRGKKTKHMHELEIYWQDEQLNYSFSSQLLFQCSQSTWAEPWKCVHMNNNNNSNSTGRAPTRKCSETCAAG